MTWKLNRVAAGAVLALAAVALTLAACSGDGDDAADADAQDDGGGGQSLTVVSSDSFAYEPDALTVGVGEHVHLTVDNTEGTLLHDLAIEGLHAEDVRAEGADHDMGEADHDEDAEAHEEGDKLHVAAGPGETAVLEFTPTEAGEYVFYCTIAGHRDAGMEGTITVVAE